MNSVVFQILALCFIRKSMDYIFTQSELFWLDHLLPEEHRRKMEDKKKSDEDGYDMKVCTLVWSVYTPGQCPISAFSGQWF